MFWFVGWTLEERNLSEFGIYEANSYYLVVSIKYYTYLLQKYFLINKL